MDNSEADTERTAHTPVEDLPPRLAEDEFYRALASSKRRRLLSYLLETTDSTVDELASVLSGWEATATGTMRTQRDRLNRRIELIHVHLPLLANTGLIEYDPATGSVELESISPPVADIIRQSINAEDRSPSPTDA
ncbi:hypothetical protein KY092_21000 [Natronomonas gomsonensis]|uniref:DUF7344 domain-containing protein n=1 Tax=Natronomonas gomsonensis TaxID=1046043 RepID=UPI00227A5EA6|nr:hypothetical protein [Natronomonas gomsonensis]MCY4733008.1 hypothetical protein [Natronomonas gomsonensis]